MAKLLFVYWQHTDDSQAALYEVHENNIMLVGKGSWAEKPCYELTNFKSVEDLKRTSKIDWHNQVVEIKCREDIDKIKLLRKLSK